MLQIRLLGGFEVDQDGNPLPGLGPQLRRLLAFLTLEANRRIGTQRLWQALWPDSDTPDIVRQSLARLRAALGPEASRLSVESGTACLDLRGAQVDLVEFNALLEQNTPEAMERAAKLYQGELLRGWEDAWITTLREDLQISYLDLLKGLAAAAMQAGSYLKAGLYLRRFVVGCPEMEWGWESLIHAYLQATSRLKALEAYQAYCSFLRRASKDKPTPLQPSPRLEQLMERIAKEEQASTLAAIQEGPPPPATTQAQHAEGSVGTAAVSLPESVGGAVPTGSPYYIERAQDSLVYTALSALAQQGSTILIKGPRQIGKTSLLARALHRARQQGACVLLTDWQNLPYTELESAESFFVALANSLADQLDLDSSPAEAFLPKRPPATNFERFLRRQVFPALSQPLVWGIDEADRLFPCSFCDDVFGKFRAWHNERALDPQGPWRTFSLILAYSTEANLFIQNLNQSPFNVGTRVTLHDFSREQVEALNARYGSPLSSNDLAQLYQLLGGHPYLLRRALSALRQGLTDLAAIQAHADDGDSLFTDHLERMRFALLLDAPLAEALRRWLREAIPVNQEQFARLCASGMMVGHSPADMRPRCLLYADYLKRALL